MLEALISLRLDLKTHKTIGARDNVSGVKGDIVVVKLSPAVWGRLEKKHFLIAFLRDDDLEENIKKRNSFRTIYPYAVYNQDGKKTTRSKYMVDLTMFDNTNGLNPDIETGAIEPNGIKNCLEITDMQLVESI